MPNVFFREPIQEYFPRITEIIRKCYLCGKTENEERLGCVFEIGEIEIVTERHSRRPVGYTYLCRNHGYSFLDCMTGLPFGYGKPLAPPKLRAITRVYEYYSNINDDTY
jgi:hypothetical protein